MQFVGLIALIASLGFLVYSMSEATSAFREMNPLFTMFALSRDGPTIFFVFLAVFAASAVIVLVTYVLEALVRRKRKALNVPEERQEHLPVSDGVEVQRQTDSKSPSEHIWLPIILRALGLVVTGAVFLVFSIQIQLSLLTYGMVNVIGGGHATSEQDVAQAIRGNLPWFMPTRNISVSYTKSDPREGTFKPGSLFDMNLAINRNLNGYVVISTKYGPFSADDRAPNEEENMQKLQKWLENMPPSVRDEAIDKINSSLGASTEQSVSR